MQQNDIPKNILIKMIKCNQLQKQVAKLKHEIETYASDNGLSLTYQPGTSYFDTNSMIKN